GAAPGTVVVVIGAGGIGSLLVAAAKFRGLSTIVIDPSLARLARALELGATHCLTTDGAELKDRVYEITGSDGPAIVIEASGAPTAPTLATDLIRPGGRIVLMGMQAEP